ncbi:MAG: hypothetical protein ACTSW5_06285, partial [Promethearchaeota archaeon]
MPKTPNNDFIGGQNEILSSNTDFIWTRTWGGNDTETGFDLWGNGTDVYTTGSTMSFGAGGRDLLLIKWDSNGNQIWNRTWGGVDDEFGNGIWGNGAYIYTTGSTKSFGEGAEDVLVIKWDSDGNQIWNRTWGGQYLDKSQSIWGNETDIYTAGFTRSFGEGSEDALVIKWDNDGNQIWNRTWGGNDSDLLYSIRGNNNFIYTSGCTESFGEVGNDLLLVKWNGAGDQIWNRTWGNTTDQASLSLWCDEEYLYLVGSAGDFLEDEMDAILIKCDYDGNKIWEQTYNLSTNTAFYSICGYDNFLYVTGTNFGPQNLEYELRFMVYDKEGNLITENPWSQSGGQIGLAIWGDDNNIYISGGEELPTGNYFNLFLAKTDYFSLSAPILKRISPDPDSDGNITLNWEEVDGAMSYYVYRDNSTIDSITGLTPIGNTTATSYTDYGLSNGT